MSKAIDHETMTVVRSASDFWSRPPIRTGPRRCSSATSRRMQGCPRPIVMTGFEETIYGLEGVTTWTIDGETVQIAPGEGLCVSRGQVHGFENHGTDDAKFLAIATPAVFGAAYFREIGHVLAASAGGPPDMAAIGEVMRRHGLTPAPPSAT